MPETTITRDVNGIETILKIPVRSTFQIESIKDISKSKIATLDSKDNILTDITGKERIFTVEFPVIDGVDYFSGISSNNRTITNFIDYFISNFDTNEAGANYKIQIKNGAEYAGAASKSTLLWDTVNELKCTIVIEHGTLYTINSSIDQSVN